MTILVNAVGCVQLRREVDDNPVQRGPPASDFKGRVIRRQVASPCQSGYESGWSGPCPSRVAAQMGESKGRMDWAEGMV
jgi:hypothetical protein